MGDIGEESDSDFGRRLSYLRITSSIFASNDDDTAASNKAAVSWPCLLFQNAKQMRQCLRHRRGYDLDEVLVEIMTHVQKGGRSTDSVVYLLGKQLPTQGRLVFCPQTTLDANEATFIESNLTLASPIPLNACRNYRLLLGAQQEAWTIQWRARVADENNRHPMPGPEDHAPCA